MVVALSRSGAQQVLAVVDQIDGGHAPEQRLPAGFDTTLSFPDPDPEPAEVVQVVAHGDRRQILIAERAGEGL
jgi:hypothetical protein